ncbi:uncharacterized protein AKAME5_001579000 [Lates japonicus]|uniref:Uncharacterized protein n=1 Tax=Lates japonicus TaxID=270547 RepID=A0AAD3N3D2_LATJO|nr:uncharacterized protein AKAME5_001579000 [Lates japonicus]
MLPLSPRHPASPQPSTVKTLLGVVPGDIVLSEAYMPVQINNCQVMNTAVTIKEGAITGFLQPAKVLQPTETIAQLGHTPSTCRSSMSRVPPSLGQKISTS